MCVKFPLGDFNPNPYPPHLTSIYTCGVTMAPRVRGGDGVFKGANCQYLTTYYLRMLKSVNKKKIRNYYT